MTLSLLTLNIRGCSAQTHNASFKVYVEQLAFNPDFLQETYNLNENSSCWRTWSHTPFCSPGISRGSGVTSLINKSRIYILSSSSVFDGYILYNKLCYNSSIIYHVDNTFIPQSDEIAILALSALHKHVSNSRYPRYAIWPTAGACHANHACAALTVSRLCRQGFVFFH